MFGLRAPAFLRAPPRVRLWIALFAFTAFAAARDARPPRADHVLMFEYAGCARVRPGPRCELGPERELTLWVPGKRSLAFAAPGAPPVSVHESRFIEGGQRTRVRVPGGAKVLQIRAGESQAELLVAESSEPAPLSELRRLWQAGKWEEVKGRLTEVESRLSTVERSRLQAFRGRLALRAGEHERAAAELEAAAKSARSAGLWLEASNDLLAAAYCRAARLLQFERARALLDGLPRELAQVPETKARIPYYLGVIARTRGDVQGALLQFRRASVFAHRLGLASEEGMARQELAVVLNLLGRRAEALAEQRELAVHAEREPNCLRPIRWENLAWMLL
ncbi:MAG TPA: hypothetical protein VFQ61_01465, partial [Polyangiaceae bacterium]|nr:hypothetical protein [Polyangiaceae bacterium]